MISIRTYFYKHFWLLYKVYWLPNKRPRKFFPAWESILNIENHLNLSSDDFNLKMTLFFKFWNNLFVFLNYAHFLTARHKTKYFLLVCWFLSTNLSLTHHKKEFLNWTDPIILWILVFIELPRISILILSVAAAIVLVASIALNKFKWTAQTFSVSNSKSISAVSTPLYSVNLPFFHSIY